MARTVRARFKAFFAKAPRNNKADEEESTRAPLCDILVTASERARAGLHLLARIELS